MTLFKSRDATSDMDKSVESEVEGEIREFVRRDVATLRRHPEDDSEIVASNISSLLQRVSGTSVQEIDRLIAELQTLRDLLSIEGARVQREIVEYATSASPRCSRPRSSPRACRLEKAGDPPSTRG